MIDAREIERCDSGRVTWSADLTTEAAKALAGKIGKFVQVTKGKDGRITTEVR